MDDCMHQQFHHFPFMKQIYISVSPDQGFRVFVYDEFYKEINFHTSNLYSKIFIILNFLKTEINIKKKKK